MPRTIKHACTIWQVEDVKAILSMHVLFCMPVVYSCLSFSGWPTLVRSACRTGGSYRTPATGLHCWRTRWRWHSRSGRACPSYRGWSSQPVCAAGSRPSAAAARRSSCGRGTRRRFACRSPAPPSSLLRYTSLNAAARVTRPSWVWVQVWFGGFCFGWRVYRYMFVRQSVKVRSKNKSLFRVPPLPAPVHGWWRHMSGSLTLSQNQNFFCPYVYDCSL